MIFKKYYIIIIIQVLLIFASCVNLAYLIIDSNQYHTIAVFSVILIAQLIYLINYFNRINRDISFFLDTLIENNSINIQTKEKSKSYKELLERMISIKSKINEDKLEKEGRSQFFEMAFDETDTGILIYSGSGKVKLINKAAKAFLGLMHLKDISQLREIKNGLDQQLKELRVGEEIYLNLNIQNEFKKLLIRTTIIKYEEEDYRIVSMSDVQNHTGIAETEAWHKLFKIISHEIMSSITPITSLSEALSSFLSKNNKVKLPAEISEKEIENTFEGLNIIKDRSQGLKSFVDGYRTLTDPPKIKVESFLIKNLINNACVLLGEAFRENEIQIAIDIENEDFHTNGDKSLLEHVIINLLKNAIDATREKETKIISIRAKRKSKRTLIEIEDNGIGMAADELENIFIPFYSTKDDGSGIGLSLSRQIMIQHKGKIFVKTSKGMGSTFSIEF